MGPWSGAVPPCMWRVPKGQCIAMAVEDKCASSAPVHRRHSLPPGEGTTSHMALAPSGFPGSVHATRKVPSCEMHRGHSEPRRRMVLCATGWSLGRSGLHPAHKRPPWTPQSTNEQAVLFGPCAFTGRAMPRQSAHQAGGPQVPGQGMQRAGSVRAPRMPSAPAPTTTHGALLVVTSLSRASCSVCVSDSSNRDTAPAECEPPPPVCLAAARGPIRSTRVRTQGQAGQGLSHRVKGAGKRLLLPCGLV